MKRALFLFATVLLTCGFSCAQQPHSATLQYVASPTQGVNYNIYRTQCGSGGIDATTKLCATPGTFAKVGSTPDLTYVDTAVTANTAYEYYLTSVCANGSCPTTADGESAPSNHAAALIPKDAGPLPPTNLIIVAPVK